MRWDFREGNLPNGVEVVGGEPEFQLQKDGSTALFLPPLAFLKVRSSPRLPRGLFHFLPF
jgi:hypothetical protein